MSVTAQIKPDEATFLQLIDAALERIKQREVAKATADVDVSQPKQYEYGIIQHDNLIEKADALRKKAERWRQKKIAPADHSRLDDVAYTCVADELRNVLKDEYSTVVRQVTQRDAEAVVHLQYNECTSFDDTYAPTGDSMGLHGRKTAFWAFLDSHQPQVKERIAQMYAGAADAVVEHAQQITMTNGFKAAEYKHWQAQGVAGEAAMRAAKEKGAKTWAADREADKARDRGKWGVAQ